MNQRPPAKRMSEPKSSDTLAGGLGRDKLTGGAGAEFAALWDEMTMVRRSAPVGAQW